jgi:peptidoglycan/LPS O-acetylase OafA/YrhL
LRAVAIILVILFHAFPEYPSGGFVGVDVFFVISGYLISGILMEELRFGQFSLLGFYARRCRRIVPALIVVLTAVLAGGWFLLLPTEYVEAAWGILGGAAFISNMVLWQQAGYFDATAAVKPLLHLWSLGIEEQFYLIWPLLLWAIYRWRLSLGTTISVLLIGSFVLMLEWPRIRAFYFLPSRFWELLLGGGLVYLERYQPGRMDAVLSLGNRAFSASVLPHLKGVVAVGLLAWSGVALANDPTFPSWNALPPTLAAFLLISAGGGGLAQPSGIGQRTGGLHRAYQFSALSLALAVAVVRPHHRRRHPASGDAGGARDAGRPPGLARLASGRTPDAAPASDVAA